MIASLKKAADIDFLLPVSAQDCALVAKNTDMNFSERKEKCNVAVVMIIDHSK